VFFILKNLYFYNAKLSKDLILDQVAKNQRESIGAFLIAYMKQTRRQTIPLPTFVTNIQKAYEMNKFGLQEMIHHTEDNQIKENELENLIQSMEKINSNVALQISNKPVAMQKCENLSQSETKSLAEKIKEQKKKLSQDISNTPKKETRKSIPAKNIRPQTRFTTGRINEQREMSSTQPFKFARKTSTSKANFEAGQEHMNENSSKKNQPKKEIQKKSFSKSKPVAEHIPREGYMQKHAEKKMQKQKLQYNIDGRISNPEPEKEEPRFDPDDYIKTAAAFNPETGLTQSFFQRSGGNKNGEDASFTERLLVENSMKNVIKRKGIQVPPRALSTEERAYSMCTFHPELYKSPKKYDKIQPRLLQHFDEPPLDIKRVPKTEQVMPSLNKSFQSVLMIQMPMRGLQNTVRPPSSRRSLCKFFIKLKK